MYKTQLSRETTKIEGIDFDDIAYSLAQFFGLAVARNCSLQTLSDVLNEKQIKNAIYFADVNHTLPFVESVSDLSEVLYGSLLSADAEKKVPTYLEADLSTAVLRIVIGSIALENHLNPTKLIHSMMQLGYADELIVVGDNETMLPPANLLIDKYTKLLCCSGKSKE